MNTALLILFLLAPPAVIQTRSSVLILDTVDNTRGLCVAISSSWCVTAYHVVKSRGYEFLLTDRAHRRFTGRLGWFSADKDLAIVYTNAVDLDPVRIAKRLPVETEDVWTWTIYEDRTMHLFEGRWAGGRVIGGQPFHVIDGYTEPGTSGGITFNSKGEAVSVLVGMVNAMSDTRGAQYMRSLVIVQPILGGIK
jgi:S1-C subfamily serine protease